MELDEQIKTARDDQVIAWRDDQKTTITKFINEKYHECLLNLFCKNSPKLVLAKVFIEAIVKLYSKSIGIFTVYFPYLY